jgi:hypothetical protein
MTVNDFRESTGRINLWKGGGRAQAVDRFLNAFRHLPREGLWVFSISRHLEGRGGRHCRFE